MRAPPASAEQESGEDEVGEGEGATLLDELMAALTKFVILPSDEAAIGVTLWIAATHAQSVFDHAPRLSITSPEKRCGKSRLLDIIEATSNKPLMAFNATVPALFRSIDPEDPPTLLLDEVDTIWGARRNSDGAEDLRALINAGFGRNRPVIRCVGPSQTPTNFSSFAMAALAGIGSCLPDTVTDRAISITMRRRAAGEFVASFRHRRDAVPLHDLRDRLSAWVGPNLSTLQDMEPSNPLEDRAADTWEPLIAVADLAGGLWPGRARSTAVALSEEAMARDAEYTTGVRLLTDLRTSFDAGPTVLSSEDLVKSLRGLPESPWHTFELDQRGLARRLRPYGIRPRQVRVGGIQVRGYQLEDCVDAFDRYIPRPPSPSDTPSSASDNEGASSDS